MVSGTGLGNFDIATVNGAWEIKKAPVTATAGSYSGTYDGLAHAPSACQVTGAYTGNLTVRTTRRRSDRTSARGLSPVVSGTGLG